jgi:alginate O-acetyltransferase complex protein AlgI
VDYVAGLKISGLPDGLQRKWWLRASLLANLGILGFFKYFNFFVTSGAELFSWLGLDPSPTTLAIILPVGISFFTFQTMSYSLDIYYGKLKPTRSLLDLALFVGFFPQLVAGPIVRAADFLPQLAAPRKWAKVGARGALLLFLSGFIKKACLSDNLAPIADAYFENPEAWTATAAWTGILAYSAQIYCDFSGYSDMAIACAALLGYRLCLNFNFPYLATDIRDFWRRWHISLSTWLRDYLYIPLGGSHGTRLFTYRNLFLTMLLGGLWHGAAWTFVVWGALHGGALVLQREWSRLTSPQWKISQLVSLLSPILTFWFVCLCWIFFRSSSFSDAWMSVRAFALFESFGDAQFGSPILWAFPALLLIHILSRWTTVDGRLRNTPDWILAMGLGVAFALALAFTRADFQPFIYFQF